MGIAATQIAKRSGAEVCGTASPGKHERISELGVDRCVDYTNPGWQRDVGKFDLILDAVGGLIVLWLGYRAALAWEARGRREAPARPLRSPRSRVRRRRRGRPALRLTVTTSEPQVRLTGNGARRALADPGRSASALTRDGA